MRGIRPAKFQARLGLFGRLARDTAGNTMVIMAIAMIPLAGLVGGGIDVSRLYLVKTRLQHACDAGTLAGRKAMGGGVWSQSNGKPNATAERFFDANFPTGGYGSHDVSRVFTESAGKVTGTVSAQVPFTLVKVIMGNDYPDQQLSVVCDAEMRLPNTDVMFVLDNTGSMAETLSGDSQTKLAALKTAVKCFYEIVARLDTDATCAGDAPSGGTGDQVQVRFGFVPYDTNVNVGRLLPPDYLANSWTYHSREMTTIYGREVSNSDSYKPDWSTGSTITVSNVASEANCRALINPQTIAASRAAISLGKNEATGGIEYNGTWEATQAWNDLDRVFKSYNTKTKACAYTQKTRNYTRSYVFTRTAASTSGAVPFKAWLYHPVRIDVSGFKNGAAWQPSSYGVTMPIGNNYVNASIKWDGCIEERHTVSAANYSPRPDGANDLDIDSVPSSWDANSLWGPALTGVVYPRRATFSNSSSYDLKEISTFSNFSGKAYSCLRESRKLAAWKDPVQFDAYVNSLVSGSNTYHDIGLLWGARLVSPTGIFRNENEYTPQGGEIQRNVIFMTDGEAVTDVDNYQAYGLGWFDRRTTDPTLVPTDGTSNTATPGTLTAQVTARTAAICASVKNMKNTTLWVIWFGASQTRTEAQLRACATEGRFFSARNSAQLQQSFADIANQISQLRLTR